MHRQNRLRVARLENAVRLVSWLIIKGQGADLQIIPYFFVFRITDEIFRITDLQKIAQKNRAPSARVLGIFKPL